jgi:hypothetical protein
MLNAVAMACGKEIPAGKRMQMVKLLFDAGCKPTVDNYYRYEPGPICACIEAEDWALLEYLLEMGADPHAERHYIHPIYDWAESEYMERVYNDVLPEHPAPEEMSDEDVWLNTLVALSRKYGTRAPVELQLLRKFGALSKSECDNGCRPNHKPEQAERENRDRLPDWELGDLQNVFLKEFCSFDWEAVKVLDDELLAWCEWADDRPWYVDYALVWARVLMRPAKRLKKKPAGPNNLQEKWVLAVFSRNPKRADWEYSHSINPSWSVNYECDGDHYLRSYSFPPGNCHVYKMLPNTFFNPYPDFRILSKSVRAGAWKNRFGLPPARFFSETDA